MLRLPLNMRVRPERTMFAQVPKPWKKTEVPTEKPEPPQGVLLSLLCLSLFAPPSIPALFLAPASPSVMRRLGLWWDLIGETSGILSRAGGLECWASSYITRFRNPNIIGEQGKGGSNPKILRSENPQLSASPRSTSLDQSQFRFFFLSDSPFHSLFSASTLSSPYSQASSASLNFCSKTHLMHTGMSLFVSLVPSLLSDWLTQKQGFLSYLIK